MKITIGVRWLLSSGWTPLARPTALKGGELHAFCELPELDFLCVSIIAQRAPGCWQQCIFRFFSVLIAVTWGFSKPSAFMTHRSSNYAKKKQNRNKIKIKSRSGTWSFSLRSWSTPVSSTRRTKMPGCFEYILLGLSVIGYRLGDFFLKTLLWIPMGSQIRHILPRWPSPNVLACLNLNLTQGHPLVAKFSNICHFRHFLRVSQKTWPKSTGLPWNI